MHGPAVLSPGEISAGTHWIGGCVGPRAGLDATEKRKILPLPEISTPAVQPAARRYTD
jgi:hypothetical protein